MSGATFVGMPKFPVAAHEALGNAQLRHNLAHATGTIRDKRARVVAEVADWEDLRTAGAANGIDLTHQEVRGFIVYAVAHEVRRNPGRRRKAIFAEIGKAFGQGGNWVEALFYEDASRPWRKLFRIDTAG